MRFLKISLSIFACLAIVLASASVSAQTLDDSDIILELSPNNPGAYDVVEAEITSFIINPNILDIQWYLDGQLVEGGVGVTKTSFTMKGDGEATILEVRVFINPVQVVTKRRSLQPLSVDILWEATDSYTPPFYHGKALAPSEGEIRFVALPTSGRNDLVYNWKKGSVEQPNASGFGKRAFVTRNNFFEQDTDVSVSLTDRSGRNGGETDIEVPRYQPLAILRAIGIDGDTTTINTRGVLNMPRGLTVLRVDPYYFSFDDISELETRWVLNDRTQPTENPLSIVLDNSSERGRGIIDLTLRHATRVLQETQQRFVIEL